MSRKRPRRLNQEPSAVTWAREECGLTKRALAESVGISEQLMNEIESEVAGTVAEILVQNGSPVEFGQPIFRIETA